MTKGSPFGTALLFPAPSFPGSRQNRRFPQKNPEQQFTWCGRRDSNSHALRRWNLNPVCLPIPPRPRISFSNKNARPGAWRFGIWGGRWESNPRHQEPQSCALPTELRPPYCDYCFLLVPKLPNGTPGRTRTCDHPLRRRMLYPAELRAPIHLQADSKLSAPAETLASPAFAVLPSDWLCSTSGANVIEAPIARQQGKLKKFSYIKELREKPGTCLCPRGSPCENTRPFSIIPNG